MRHVRVAILGAGTAGLSALREVRKVTHDFVVVNDGPWGTMCAMRTKSPGGGEFELRTTS